LLIVAFSIAPSMAGRKSRSVSINTLPPWLQGALSSQTPSTSENYVWLHVEKIVEPVLDGGVRITVRQAGRILKPSGLDDLHYATFATNQDDVVESFRAWTIEPGGRAVLPDKKDDFDDEPYIRGYGGYNDTRLRSVRLSGLAVGSVAAWEHVRVIAIDRGAEACILGSSSHPTVFASCTLTVPDGWNSARVEQNIDGLDLVQHADGFTLSGDNLEPLPAAELRPPAGDLMPMVWMRWWSPDEARGYESWNHVAAWFSELAAPVFSDAGEAAEISARLAPSSPDEIMDAVSRAFDFTSREVRYVAIQIGIGGYQPYSPASVCRNRFGDCKDKTFLFRSIVEGWDLKTYPVLVRTAHLGVTHDKVPSPVQFNHCIAAVALPDGAGENLWPVTEVEGLGRLLFLDATSRLGGAWILPTGDQGTLALVIDGDNGKLIRLPVQPPKAAVVQRRLQGRLDAGGQLSEAELVETWNGTRASGIRGYYEGKTEKQRTDDVLHDLQSRFPGASIGNYEIRGLDEPGAEITEITHFEGAQPGKRAGGLLLIEPMELGFGVAETALPPPPREWPLNTGKPRREVIEFEIVVPNGWVPESMPDPEEVSCEDLTARSEWSFEDGVLRFSRSADLLSYSVPPDRYETFRNAVRALKRMDNRGIVLVPTGNKKE
jgi:hypothetical protein